MKEEIYYLLTAVQNGEQSIDEIANQLLDFFAIMPSLPIERFDTEDWLSETANQIAEDWLGENKDIWNHPIITDRTDKESYEVADLMAEFANQFFRQ